MNEKHYDVIINGAGPAGLTCARILAENNLKVALLEKNSEIKKAALPGGKTCGGLLSERAKQELAKQSLQLPSYVLSGPQIFAVQCHDINTGLQGLFRRNYINMDRMSFESWLSSLLPATVDILWEHRFCGFEKNNRQYDVFVKNHDGEKTISGNYVIGASGANSLIRYRMEKKRRASGLMAVQLACELQGDNPYFQTFFSKKIKNFYGWLIPKGSYSLVGCAAAAQKKPQLILAEMMEWMNHNGLYTGNILDRGSSMIETADRKNPIITGREKVLLVGEAARFVSPSSGEGIGFALASGAAAARAILENPDKPLVRYNRFVQPLKTDIFIRRIKKTGYYSSVVRSFLFATGIGSLKKNPLVIDVRSQDSLEARAAKTS